MLSWETLNLHPFTMAYTKYLNLHKKLNLKKMNEDFPHFPCVKVIDIYFVEGCKTKT